MKRELQKVTIFSRACSIIKKLKAENNLFTQLEPVKRFEAKPIHLIKESLKRQKEEKSKPEPVIEEKKVTPTKAKRKRKFEQISTPTASSDGDEDRKVRDFKEIHHSEDSDSEYEARPLTNLSTTSYQRPSRLEFLKTSTTNHKTKRLKEKSIPRNRLMIVRNTRRRDYIFKTKPRKESTAPINSAHKNAQEYVLCATGLSSAQKDLFECFCSHFDIEVSEEVEEGYTTHLVAMDMKKTGKLAKAVFYNVNVVGYEWVIKCMSQAEPSFISPKGFYLLERVSGKEEEKRFKRLFENKNFVISHGLKSVSTAKKIDLKELIQKLGGCVHRTLNSAIKDFEEKKKLSQILYQVSDKVEPPVVLPKALRSKTKTVNVSYEWLVD